MIAPLLALIKKSTIYTILHFNIELNQSKHGKPQPTLSLPTRVFQYFPAEGRFLHETFWK